MGFVFPSLGGYQRSWLRGDLVAGLTVWAVLVPEALAMRRGSPSASRMGRAGLRMRVRNRYLVARTHRGIGKVSALINEDLSLAGRDMLAGNFSYSLHRLRGIVEGLTRRKT